MPLDENVERCSEDAEDGYRMWHEDGNKKLPYCSLLMPQDGSKPGECPYQGPLVTIKKRAGLSSSDLSVYLCLKQNE